MAIRLKPVLVFTAIVLSGACSDDLHRGVQYPSPTGRYLATFFGLSGGGAAGWAYSRVSVRSAQQPFDRESHILEMRHGYEVCLIWESDTKLVVEYPSEAVVMSSDRVVQLDDALAISYCSRESKYGTFVDDGCAGCLAKDGAVGEPWRSCGR